MFRTTVFLVIITIMLSVLVACGGEEQSTEDLAAIVNEQEIPRAEYEEALEQTQNMYAQNGMDLTQDEEMMNQVKQQVLDELVNQALLTQAAQERNIEVSDEKVQEDIETLKASFGEEAQFEEALATNNLTVEELEELIIEQEKIEMLIKEEIGEITVSEEEIQEMFDQFAANSQEDVNLDEVRPMIEQQLREQKKYEKTLELIEVLKEDANIEIYV